MKKIIVLILISIVTLNIQAQTKHKIYREVPLTQPDFSTKITITDLQLDKNRLRKYPDGTIFATLPVLKNLFDYLQNDVEGKNQWSSMSKTSAQMVSNWKLSHKGQNDYRYIYANLNNLSTLSYVYMFSGNKILLEFIKANMKKMARLPLDFWLHSELRGLNEKKPLGMLETAMLSTALGYSLSIIEDDLSKTELAEIKEAFRTKGYIPCLNWLDKPRFNNFTAVIGNGAFVAAKYFNDDKGKEKALNAISFYLNNTIEQDGSYGEGVGYFNYPLTTLRTSMLCMNDDERNVFRESSLGNTSKWIVYSLLFQRNQENKLIPSIINFGDNCPFEGTLVRGTSSSYPMLTALFGDSLLPWLHDKFNLSYSFVDKLMLLSINAKMPSAKSPKQLALPTSRVFDNGDCFIRSSWDDNAIVFGMRSGDGSKVKYGHQRPELHSVALAAYGEQMIVCAGSASYRSPIHYGYDKTTRAANTITIDGKNQLFPGKGVNFIKFDNSAFWVQGEPKSSVTKFTQDNDGSLLRCDAPAAYHIPMKEASRTVKYISEEGFFIVVDRMKSTDGTKHTFNYRLHLNNGDEKAIVKSTGNNNWVLNRPMADLHIALWSNKSIGYSENKGYMHVGTKRDYSPGGPAEGKLGSAIEMDWSNNEPTDDIEFISVLFPQKKNQKKPVFSLEKGAVLVNGKRYALPN